jgi:excisionase family DNA binding protein
MNTSEGGRLLLDYQDAGEQLSVGRTTIYGLVERGELRTVKIGRRSLITRDSLEAFVERLSRAGDPVAS